MKEDVLEVLMYLFENYLDEDTEVQSDQEALKARLSEAGFHASEIHKAFHWLEGLSALCEDVPEGLSGGRPQSTRHYSSEEADRLGPAGRGFLMRLEQYGILDAQTREMVVDRIMALETGDIDLEQIKWVVMMVLYNRPDREEQALWLEDMVLDEPRQPVH